jgi:hypothetical protein
VTGPGLQSGVTGDIHLIHTFIVTNQKYLFNTIKSPMKTLILFTLLAFCLTGYAQDFVPEKPAYKKIEKKIKSKKSGFYYPELFQRYLNSDSTFTIEQKRHLYYGFAFQPNYAPYDISVISDSVRAIYDKTELADTDYIELLRYSDSLLADNPFNLRAMDTKLFVYDHLANEAEFMKNMIKMNSIYDAILSSGDGTTMEDAFYVIFTTHEYDLLRLLGLNFGGEQSLIDHYDYLKLQENEYGLKGLYFDVSPCLNHLGLMLK